MAALPDLPQAIVLHFAYILLCKMFSKMLTPMGAFCIALHFGRFCKQNLPKCTCSNCATRQCLCSKCFLQAKNNCKTKYSKKQSIALHFVNKMQSQGRDKPKRKQHPLESNISQFHFIKLGVIHFAHKMIINLFFVTLYL